MTARVGLGKSQRQTLDFGPGLKVLGEKVNEKIEVFKKIESYTAQYEQSSKVPTPSDPRGSIWGGPTLKSHIFRGSWMFRAKTYISTTRERQKRRLFDFFRTFRATPPP